MNVSRDDFVIAIRSAFLKKQTKQKFSLLSLIILSIFILFLGSFDSKIVNLLRSGISEVIYKGSSIISTPEKIVKNLNHEVKSHLGLYSNSKKLEKEVMEFRSKKISLDILKFENQKFRKTSGNTHPTRCRTRAPRCPSRRSGRGPGWWPDTKIKSRADTKNN